MIKAVPFRSSDFVVLKEKGVLTVYGDYVTEDSLLRLESNPYSATLIDEETLEVFAIGGAIEVWENRAHLWLFIDPACRKRFFQIHNAVNRYINALPFRRVEAIVEVDFAEGNRWMPLLKFEREGILRAYGVDGKDMVMYSKIKELS
jgi:hypothetical protein